MADAFIADEYKMNESPKPVKRQVVSKSGEDGRIISKIKRKVAEGRTFYSFEYFPPKTEAGVLNLYDRLDRMSLLEPMFMDVTWGAGGSTADLTLEISINAQNYCSAEVMMHLTCTNMPRDAVKAALEKAKAGGIRNILALRGDPPKGAEAWEACENGFEHAVDLVKFIRQEYGDYFGIAVAGYPEGHIACTSIEDDIKHLKNKVDAGADFVITQLFYDVDLFAHWVKKCRAAGINCPIIPGIMPIQNYAGFKRMTSFCKTAVPQFINDALEPIKDDDERVKSYGIELGIQMGKKLMAIGVEGLHFYTLNLEKSVTHILEGLDFVTPFAALKGKHLPWVKEQPQASEADSSMYTVSKRRAEEVRPIFWANRPRSYLLRTNTWDEFPNGRWGDARSPAFGDLSDYHLCSFKTGKADERRRIWGESPKDVKDVYEVFANYIEGNISRLPWCENALMLETIPLKNRLSNVNRKGFLTINSQPRINGAPSDDSAVGWGGKGGYVYQKAYLEFFTSPDNMKKIVELMAQFPSLTFQATNVRGETLTNVHTERGVNAVTWGVFPAREIIQPTVVDPASFMVWKDEAFALWKSQWQSIYPEDSSAHKLLQTVHDTFWLINIVDNDFIKGDIFAIFDKLFEQPSSKI